MPKRLRARVTVIHQSAVPLPYPRRPSRDAIVVSVIGHLRDVKDPLRAAEAARLLPPTAACASNRSPRLYAEWANRARAEMAANRAIDGATTSGGRRPATPGAQPCMVISSLSEGGRQRGLGGGRRRVPVLASRMDGNVGLLGADYPGYYPVGDTKRWRGFSFTRREPRFSSRLGKALARRAVLFGRHARLPPGAACSPTSAPIFGRATRWHARFARKPSNARSRSWKSYEGGCLCGAVRLRRHGSAQSVLWCHCQSLPQAQRRAGFVFVGSSTAPMS